MSVLANSGLSRPAIGVRGRLAAAARFWALALGLLAIMAAIQITTLRQETATWDEPLHIAAGYSYLETGEYRMNSEHPALAKMLCALPLYLMDEPDFDSASEAWKKGEYREAGNFFLYNNTVDSETLLYTARNVTVALTMLFGVYLAWWTQRRFGAPVALFALALFAFDPNLIAHGRYVTTDLAVALFTFTTLTLWIEYLDSARRHWFVLAGVSLGLALTSKYSAVFLPPVLLAMYVWRRRNWKGLLWCTLGLAGLSLTVIAIVYAPEILHPGQLPKLRAVLTRSGILSEMMWLVARRLPIRAYSFLVGIDRLSNHNVQGHLSYLLGQVSDHGWWYYFPVAFAVKTPLSVLAALGAALALVWRSRRRGIVTALLVAPVVYFGIAMAAHIDIGVRHLLPIYAFLYVVIAIVLLERVRWRWLALAVPLLAAVECLAVYPYYLAFFNVAAGGPSAGHRYLLDSNLDWGQDIKRLSRYLQDRGIQRIQFCYFGNVDLDRYRIWSDSIPDNATAATTNAVVVISATPLYGLYVPVARYAWLRALKPTAIIGHSLYVYDLRKPPA